MDLKTYRWIFATGNQDKVREIYRKDYTSMSEFIHDLMEFYDDYKIYL